LPLELLLYRNPLPARASALSTEAKTKQAAKESRIKRERMNGSSE